MFIKGNMPHPVGRSPSALVPIAQTVSLLRRIASSFLPTFFHQGFVRLAGINGFARFIA